MSGARPENFMPLWIADYLADTMHLTARQHGEYLLLLMFSWKQDRPLPKADAALRAIARASESEWTEDREVVLAFFEEGQNGYRQKRLEEERAEAVERYNSVKARSALGVAARQAKRPPTLPEVTPEVTLGANTTHNLHISKDIEDMSGSATPDGYSPAFQSFWKSYPRTENMSKKAAFDAWNKQKKHLPPLESLLVCLAKYRSFIDSETKVQGRQYPVKHAQGWLNERRWETYLTQQEAQNPQAARHLADWADEIPEWADFKAKLSPTEWAMWFSKVKPNGSIASLVLNSSFELEKIGQKYLPRLQSHFGPDFHLKVKGP